MDGEMHQPGFEIRNKPAQVSKSHGTPFTELSSSGDMVSLVTDEVFIGF
jgi:hypothetical protein